MAFRRKALVLVCLLAGIMVLFGFLIWDSQKPAGTIAPPQAQHELEINNSSQDVVVSGGSPVTHSMHEMSAVVIPNPLEGSLNDRQRADMLPPPPPPRADIEMPLPKKVGRPLAHISDKANVVQVPGIMHALPPLSVMDSASVKGVLPAAPQPTAVMNPISGGENSIAMSAPAKVVTPEQWTDPVLEKITAIVSFPQTKTYRLRETFIVTLAVNKGVDDSISAKATQGLGIKGSTTSTSHPLMTPSRHMKATLMYANKKVESGEPEIQPVSLTEATLWTWEITPDTPGRHYMKILLSAHLPNNQPDFSKPFIYQLTVTEDLWSHIKRIMTEWITPQWISADWLWKTILLPAGVFILWQLRARWRAYRRKKKLAQQDEQHLT